MYSHYQFSVIAKVNDCYRVLSTIECSFPSAHAVLRRSLGTLEIFQDAANRMPIQQELYAAKKFAPLSPKWDRDWDVCSRQSISLPFITTCLIIGVSFGFDDGYHEMADCQLLRTWLAAGSFTGTIFFDVTDPGRVRYGFECSYYGSNRGLDAPIARPIISMSAYAFLQAYYDLDDPETKFLFALLLKSFKNHGLIPASTLRSIWPHGEHTIPKINDDTVHTFGLDNLDVAASSTSVRSLTDMAMDSAVKTVVDGSIHNKDLLTEEALELKDFRLAVQSRLQQIGSELPQCDATIQVLCKAFEDCAEVDLSPFQNISLGGLSLIVSQLQKHDPITTLGISNRPDLTLVGLEKILGPQSTLTTLCLLANPGLSSEDGDKLLDRFDIHHSDHIRQPISCEPGDFIPVSSLMNRPVSELVWVGIPTANFGNPSDSGNSTWNRWEKSNSDLDLGNFRNTTRSKYTKWPLDISLRPVKIVTGFLRLLQWAVLSFLSYGVEFGKGAALSLALASSRNTDPGSEVGRLSSILYGHSNGARLYASGQRLQPGHWAFIVLHEGFDVPSQAMKDEAQIKPRKGKFFRGASDSSEQLHEIQGRKGVKYALVRFDSSSELSQSESTQSKRTQSKHTQSKHTQSEHTQSKLPQSNLTQVDVPQYLKYVMGDSRAGDDQLTAQELGDWWNRKITSIGNVEYCGEGDMNEIVRRVYADNFK